MYAVWRNYFDLSKQNIWTGFRLPRRNCCIVSPLPIWLADPKDLRHNGLAQSDNGCALRGRCRLAENHFQHSELEISIGQPIYPVSLKVEGGDRLAIEWNDGVRQELSWAVLRKSCPCAGCRTERDKPTPLLPIITIDQAQPPKPRSIEPVGRYAYQFYWNDGHESGLYTFEMLRELGQQSQAE